jgi:hypothetical protein
MAMPDTLHPAAIEHLPFFITAPGQTDVLFYAMLIFMLAMILIVGNLYFQLHALPERMAHRTSLVQMEFVAVLALISLFTHNHLFWVAALLLALIQFPDFSSPMISIAGSLEKIAGTTRDVRPDEQAMQPPSPPPHADAPIVKLAEPAPHAERRDLSNA